MSLIIYTMVLLCIMSSLGFIFVRIDSRFFFGAFHLFQARRLGQEPALLLLAPKNTQISSCFPIKNRPKHRKTIKNIPKNIPKHISLGGFPLKNPLCLAEPKGIPEPFAAFGGRTALVQLFGVEAQWVPGKLLLLRITFHQTYRCNQSFCKKNLDKSAMPWYALLLAHLKKCPTKNRLMSGRRPRGGSGALRTCRTRKGFFSSVLSFFKSLLSKKIHKFYKLILQSILCSAKFVKLNFGIVFKVNLKS